MACSKTIYLGDPQLTSKNKLLFKGSRSISANKHTKIVGVLQINQVQKLSIHFPHPLYQVRFQLEVYVTGKSAFGMLNKVAT